MIYFKNFLFFFFLFSFGLFLNALGDDHEVKEFDETKPGTKEDVLMTEVIDWGIMTPPEYTGETKEETAEPPEEKQKEKKKFTSLTNRSFELSLAQTSVNVSNNFISAMDIYKRPIVILFNIKDIIEEDFRLIYRDNIEINIDEFFNGFKFDLNTTVKPLSININSKDRWGFGLDIGHINVIGNFSLPEKMLKVEEAKDEKGGLGGAAFADIGIPVFFNVRDFKVKIRPAVYLPVFYVEPNVTYNFGRSFHEGNEGTRISADYKIDLYSIFKIEDGDFSKMQDYLFKNYWNILRENLGYDLGFGLEYRFNSWLDIGVDVFNLPFYRAKLYDYLKLHGEVFVDSSYININEVIEQMENYKVPEGAYGYPEDFEILSAVNKNGQKIFRPFKMIFYGNYRPFDKPILTLVPSLGFSVSRIYLNKGAVEGGLSAILNLKNIFYIKGGINYNDRIWKNSLDFVLNSRLLEINLGISSQSQEFKKSFNYSGFGVNFGLKLGF